MASKEEVLKTNFPAQINWLKNQLSKSNNSIFLNPDKAIKAFEELENNSLILSEDELYKYLNRYLSESGKNKLVTTLRVSETRSKNFNQLQVPLDYEASKNLKYLIKKTGLKQVEIVNLIIKSAQLSELENKTDEE